MSKISDLAGVSDEELMAELAHRRAPAKDISDEEDAAEAAGERLAWLRVEQFFKERMAAQTDASRPCPRCGKPCSVRRRDCRRTVRSHAGEHELTRRYHYCGKCRQGFFPLDGELGLPAEGELTPKMERRVLDLGLNAPFEESAERWGIHHAGTISENLVRQVVARAGAQLMATSLPDSDALGPHASTAPELVIGESDGSMVPTRGTDAWREIKLCAIYRQEHHGNVGRRGIISQARYVAEMGDMAKLRDATTEALERERAWEARRAAWLGDGAPCNWTLAEEVLPRAVQILDWGHAIEAAVTCAKVVLGEQEIGLIATWQRTIEHLVGEGRVTEVLQQLESCQFLARGKAREALTDLSRYYRNNRERMHYQRYLADGLPIGSGAIESAHKHVLQQRMKLAGQHWDPARARIMAKLRAAQSTVGPRRLYAAIRKLPAAA
jgi:hypothetical protein